MSPTTKLFVKVAVCRFASGPRGGPLCFWTPEFTLGLVTLEGLVTPEERIFWP